MNGEMLVLSGNANKPLSEAVASYLGTELGNAEVGTFSDGETKVKINTQVREHDVFVIQSLCRNRMNNMSVNDALAEVSIMADSLKRASARCITAVLPYYGYARQDRKGEPRVPISAKWVADVLTVSGVRKVLSLDLHADQIQGFFDIPVDVLAAAPRIFVPHIRAAGLEDAVIVSPDVGRSKVAERTAKILGSKKAIVDKTRQDDTHTEAGYVLGNVDGKRTIIVDDICASGSTLVEAARVLVEYGASEVYAAATHAVFSGPAMERLQDSPIKEIWVTDTIPHRKEDLLPTIRVMSAARLIGEGIRRVHTGESISELYA